MTFFANNKTKETVGFNFMLQKMETRTPYGFQRLKEIKAYEIGEEGKLKEELDLISHVIHWIKDESETIQSLDDILCHIKELKQTIRRSRGEDLTVVELYELKVLFLHMEKIKSLLDKLYKNEVMPGVPTLDSVAGILKKLDPSGHGLETFFISDEFSENLAILRQQRKVIEGELKTLLKSKKTYIQSQYHIKLSPKNNILVAKSNAEQIEAIKGIKELVVEDEDYLNIKFKIPYDEAMAKKENEINEYKEKIEMEEMLVRRQLSREVFKWEAVILNNLDEIGRLDFLLSKGKFSIEYECVKPTILETHEIHIVCGRHIQVESILKEKGKTYTPISIDLNQGATCITGANMGGKTITLKLVGLMALMVQHGLFVPCQSMKIGLSTSVNIITGDSQSLERGLSTFGSEMENVRVVLENVIQRGIVLIDEIASGTNPMEGLGLTKSLVEYLSQKPYISLVTTHFDHVAKIEGVKNLQVMGLGSVDMKALGHQLKYARHEERLNMIGSHMDYRLMEVKENSVVPKDALNIARAMGIDENILKRAQEIIEEN